MKINRFLCVVAVGLCYTCPSLTLHAGGVNAKLGKWHILYDETQQRFSLKNGKDLVSLSSTTSIISINNDVLVRRTRHLLLRVVKQMS